MHTLNNPKHLPEWRDHQEAAQAASLVLETVLTAVHHPSGRWPQLSMNGIVLFNPVSVTVTRYRYRGVIPTREHYPGSC
jgi:hypothetical protein